MPKQPRQLACGPNVITHKIGGSAEGATLLLALGKAMQEITGDYAAAENDLVTAQCPNECIYKRPNAPEPTWTGDIQIKGLSGGRCRIKWSLSGKVTIFCHRTKPG